MSNDRLTPKDTPILAILAASSRGALALAGDVVGAMPPLKGITPVTRMMETVKDYLLEAWEIYEAATRPPFTSEGSYLGLTEEKAEQAHDLTVKALKETVRAFNEYQGIFRAAYKAGDVAVFPPVGMMLPALVNVLEGCHAVNHSLPQTFRAHQGFTEEQTREFMDESEETPHRGIQIMGDPEMLQHLPPGLRRLLGLG